MTGQFKRGFSWLHISDLHFGQGKQWLWPAFKTQFLNDLAVLLKEVGSIDLVIFSGDLTQSGKLEEFEGVTRVLIEILQVLRKNGSDPGFLAVPGNHDLTRPAALDSRVIVISKLEGFSIVREEFFKPGGLGSEYRDLVDSAFANYRAWYSTLKQNGVHCLEAKHGLMPGDVSATANINDLQIGLVGLNTAFLQLGDWEVKGRLELEIRQLQAVTDGDPDRWCALNDFNFLITHHPPDWLNASSAESYLSDIYLPSRFVAHLYGHMHVPAMTSVGVGGAPPRRCVQAASLFGLEKLKDGQTARFHGYSVGAIERSENGDVWRLWPRTRITTRTNERRIVCDNEFALKPGEQFLEEYLTGTGARLESSGPVDLTTAVEDGAWEVARRSLTFNLRDAIQHANIRLLQQQICADSLRNNRVTWVAADWGLGIDGFIWSVLERLGIADAPKHRISLGNYIKRDDFLTAFQSIAGCHFPEFCKALAGTGKAVLVFDDAPVGRENPIARDAEELALMIADFCPELFVIITSRTKPDLRKVRTCVLDPLDEADTKSYLEDHPEAEKQYTDRHAVSEIYRRSDGLPGKVDAILKTLRVVALSELDPVVAISSKKESTVFESIPASLIAAVGSLSVGNPVQRRAWFLLKILAILAQGESLQRVKRFDATSPVRPEHAELLLDLDLVKVRSSSNIILPNQNALENSKILYSPRSVRDYVLTKMSLRETIETVKKAISLYFGEGWRSGDSKVSLAKDALTTDDGSLLANPHALVVWLLQSDSTWETSATAGSALRVCHAYVSSLMAAKHYRHCITVCKDFLSLIDPKYVAEKNSITYVLARATRMTGQAAEARVLCEALLQLAWPKELRITLNLDYALALQSLGDESAIAVAQQVIGTDPKSASAAQAKSIVLEMSNDVDRAAKLRRLEIDARKKGHVAAANNLTLGRVKPESADESDIELLRTVFTSSTAQGDQYTAARAAIKIATINLQNAGQLSAHDLRMAIQAYQYCYGERTEGLFAQAHWALWTYFQRQSDVRNLLSLFRHSSFIWRLSGKPEREKTYTDQLIGTAKSILAENILTADRNTAYFLLRVRDQTHLVSSDPGV